MDQSFAEILLFAFLGINAALLIFIAGVLRQIMNEMDEATFKNFVVALVRYSSRSPFMLITLNIPFLGAIPYFYFYGFGNVWLLAALVLWLVAGLISKAIKVPIYKKIETLESSDAIGLREQRQKLNTGNIFQAILNVAAFALSAVAFIKR